MDTDVIVIGVQMMHFLMPFYLLYIPIEVLFGALRGMGNALAPTLLTFFGVCLPWKLYHSPQFMVKDVATHLTFLFPFFADTYLSTPLGAACWTLAIEAQAYLLFPWVARASLRHPGRVCAVTLGLCWGLRCLV